VLLGQTLGHYQLLEFVGGGGMGAVFRGLDTMLNRIVAVKVLSHTQSDDEETLRRFKNEAQSAARLDHENIGRVHYVGEADGWHYIVFEFIEGINLRDLVERDGPLRLSDAVSYMLQLGDALAHAARRDVVHRDIKPSNVLITPEGKAKLVDMGLARLHQVEHANNDLTASGVTLGTFDYISPEQARDPRSADVRSDLYSLGCTFYFMLTGRPPFPEGTVLQKLLQHQGDEPPDPRRLCADLPDDVYRILKRLLAKSPDHRYQQPAEMVAELTQAAVRLRLRSAAPGSMVWLTSASGAPWYWRQSLPWIAPLAALALIVVILNVFWANPEESPPSLLGRLPRAENLNKAKVVAGDSARNSSGRKGDVKSAAKANSTNGAGNMSGELTLSGDRGALDAPLMWIESAASVPKEIATSVWTTVQSEDFASRLTTVRENLSLPFLIDLRPSANGAESSSTRASALQAQRIVAGKRAGPAEYPSLNAAIRGAKSGEIIELRFNEILDEKPLDITDLKLTIRAAEGFRPVVRFQPDVDDVLAERRSMVNIDGGQLTLDNVHFDFTLPSDVSDRWSLFEVSRADALSLQSCSVTVRNSGAGFDRPSASMIDVRASLADGAGMMKDMAPPKKLEIEVRDSVFRGEATFLHFAAAQPIELRADNALLALSERLIDGDVGLTNTRGTSGMYVELRRVTILAQSGLVRLTNDSDASDVMPVEMSCYDSILAGNGIPAMIEQFANESTDSMRRQFSWTGSRSVYDGFASLWRLNGAAAVEDFDFEQWRNTWDENRTAYKPIEWSRLPIAGRALHAYAPPDFALRYGVSPASEAASNGSDAGAALPLLPQLPRH